MEKRHRLLEEPVPPPKEVGFLRPHQAACWLGVSERTLRRMIARGEIGSSKFGQARVVPKAELDRLVAEAGKPSLRRRKLQNRA